MAEQHRREAQRHDRHVVVERVGRIRNVAVAEMKARSVRLAPFLSARQTKGRDQRNADMQDPGDDVGQAV